MMDLKGSFWGWQAAGVHAWDFPLNVVTTAGAKLKSDILFVKHCRNVSLFRNTKSQLGDEG